MPVNRYTTPREGLVAKPLSFEDYTRAGTVRADSASRLAEFSTTDLSYDVLPQDNEIVQQKVSGIETAISDITKSLTAGTLTSSDYDKALAAKREQNNLFGEHGDVSKAQENARVQRAWTAKINELAVTKGWTDAKKQFILNKGNTQFQGSFNQETGAFQEFKPEFTDVFDENQFYHDEFSKVKGSITSTLQTLSEKDGFRKVYDDNGIDFFVINEANGQKTTNASLLKAKAEELKAQVRNQESRLGSQFNYFEATDEDLKKQESTIDKISKQYEVTSVKKGDLSARFVPRTTNLDINKPAPPPNAGSYANLSGKEERVTPGQGNFSTIAPVADTIANLTPSDRERIQTAVDAGETPNELIGLQEQLFKPNSALASALKVLGHEVPDISTFKKYENVDGSSPGTAQADYLNDLNPFDIEKLYQYIREVKELTHRQEFVYTNQISVDNTLQKEFIDEAPQVAKAKVKPEIAGKNILDTMGNADLIVDSEGNAITYAELMNDFGGNEARTGKESDGVTYKAFRKGVLGGDNRFARYGGEYNPKMLGSNHIEIIRTDKNGKTETRTFFIENHDYYDWLVRKDDNPSSDTYGRSAEEYINRERILSETDGFTSQKMWIINPDEPAKKDGEGNWRPNYINADVTREISVGKLGEDGEILPSTSTTGEVNLTGEGSESGYMMIRPDGSRIGIDNDFLRTRHLSSFSPDEIGQIVDLWFGTPDLPK